MYLKATIDSFLDEYRDRLYLPITTNWKDYESSHRTMIKCMALELMEMIDSPSDITVDEFGRPSLLNENVNYKLIL